MGTGDGEVEGGEAGVGLKFQGRNVFASIGSSPVVGYKDFDAVYMTVPNSEVKSRAAVIVNTARVRPALQQGCQLSGAALDGHHSKLVPAHVLNEQEESFFPLQEQETPTTIM
mmetsp:Transcript_3518/g.6586  ORF Transcript_3518/g.6586 Transcript_3518/m.6586 type:complete len:113 (-) Transcript_3518:88-426(-)|eukprot:CAMPEP_0182508146 /NCGR_PEP_ID=MMETSP1321-20130603/24466_1 /TAXON_ID=91990 /ORGANISM="Bolidomonas sp., Strain RCC1657" /LENGTH=112 /DNA_ID=CAMNT_0024714179 /DNA_START=529 /DNA_END=867 /DNA_ORIENTATION=+